MKKLHFSSVNAFVMLAMTAPFTKASAQEPFVLSASCNLVPKSGTCVGALPNPPAGRRVVIEFVTALCDVAFINEPASYLILTTQTSASARNKFYLAPSNTTLVPQSNRTYTSFTHGTKIYLGPSSNISYEFAVLNSHVVGQCNLTLQGR
jgi:hypothetical protein